MLAYLSILTLIVAFVEASLLLHLMDIVVGLGLGLVSYTVSVQQVLRVYYQREPELVVLDLLADIMVILVFVVVLVPALV